MSYFADHSSALSYAIASEERSGLRSAQAGAAHAVASHFSIRQDPAFVCMPTGSGKTAVILMSAYALSASRALVITPTTIVRGQFAEIAASLELLKNLGVLPGTVPGPRIREVRRRITHSQEWEQLRDYDLVVATPHTLSPVYSSIPPPPADLFDVILVDEAHHEAARTWQALLDSAPAARRVLFSATPFRRDRKEIRGRFIFEYPLRQAFRDGLFSPVTFAPAEPMDAPPDIAIARTTERIYRAEREAGLDHRIMARTGSKARALELGRCYASETGLRMRVVTSDHSYRYAKTAVAAVRSGDLDGVICVDMFGEGFDLPQLKLAALHAPHRSLAVTLQFIGRFARVTGGAAGATVIAVPQELGDDVSRLYAEDATWPEMLIDFSATAVGRERMVREGISTFDDPDITVPQLANLSLYGLRPFCHAKVYRCLAAANMRAAIDLPPPSDVVLRRHSDSLALTILVSLRIDQPKWCDAGMLSSRRHDLLAVYYDESTSLLFINSSIRTNAIYDRVATQLTDGAYQPLSAERINRVLRDIDSATFFQVGMKNTSAASSVESYMIRTGSRAHEAVSPQEGRLYHRGHIMARGRKRGESVTIGFSSSSRVWSMQFPQVVEWRDWCRSLARDIADDSPFQTGTNLDILQPGKEVEEIPGPVIAVMWPAEAYRKSLFLKHPSLSSGHRELAPLLDAEIRIDFESAPDGSPAADVVLVVEHGGMSSEVLFRPGQTPMFQVREGGKDWQVERHGEDEPLTAFLEEHPPILVLDDCSLLEGKEYRSRNADAAAFAPTAAETVDWASEGVEVTREFRIGAGLEESDGSIHGYMLQRLQNEAATIITYDHGPGEVADFIGVWDEDDVVIVRYYHCKGSSRAEPGCRLKDLYEVVGQAIKCSRWIHRSELLVHHLERRTANTTDRWRKGRLRELDRLLRESPKRKEYEVVIVQPGLAVGQMSEAAANLLGAATEYLWRDLGGKALKVVASR